MLIKIQLINILACWNEGEKDEKKFIGHFFST